MAGLVRILAVAATLSALVCGGCVSVNIKDLAPASVEAVEREDHSELEVQANSDRAHELFLKTSFTSHADLTRIDDAISLRGEGLFCSRPNAHVRLVTPHIFWRGVKLSHWPDSIQIQPDESDPRAPITYYTFIRVALEERQPGNPPFESFDLRRQPEDVCIRLVGGPYRAFGWQSNTMKISKEVITEALRKVGAEPVDGK